VNNFTSLWHTTTVRSYSGYKADERPVSFRFGDDHVEIHEILESWYDPDHLCFRVLGNDDRVYTLRHHERDDVWMVRVSARSKRPRTGFPAAPISQSKGRDPANRVDRRRNSGRIP